MNHLPPYDFRVCKFCSTPTAVPTFHLKNRQTVYVCNVCKLHYLDYLDPVPGDVQGSEGGPLTDDQLRAIEKTMAAGLESSAQRVAHHIDLVRERRALPGLRVLDIGAGGGRFMHLLQLEGADVTGIEPYPDWAEYVRSTFDLPVDTRPIEHPYWQTHMQNRFDVAVLWDVIEHVNFPLVTVQSAMNVLKPGGLLLLDTPYRDAFYHRFGEFTYRLTRGRFPTFLNIMYSSRPFSHKQILSLADMQRLADATGAHIEHLEQINELSFPYQSYLKSLLKSDVAVRAVEPFVRLFFRTVQPRNKMVVVMRKYNGDESAGAAVV